MIDLREYFDKAKQELEQILELRKQSTTIDESSLQGFFHSYNQLKQ